MENTSYQFQYQYLQLDLYALMVWECGNRKMLNVASFEDKFDNWARPDNSKHVIVSLVNRN